MRTDEAAEAADAFDLVLLEQELDALGVLVDDLALVALRLQHVELRVDDLDAEVGAVPRLVEQLRGVEQRLGRDAPAMQTGAAELRVLLDHRHLHAELTGADARDVPARAAADDDEVVVEGAGRCRRRRRLWSR